MCAERNHSWTHELPRQHSASSCIIGLQKNQQIILPEESFDIVPRGLPHYSVFAHLVCAPPISFCVEFTAQKFAAVSRRKTIASVAVKRGQFRRFARRQWVAELEEPGSSQKKWLI